MADQSGRQPFRFRLPWVVNPPAPVPPRALAEPQPSATAVPPQRPPFRPPGPPPPRPFIPTRADSLPPSRVASQPSSPVRTAPPSRVASQPASPSKPIPPPSPAPTAPTAPPSSSPTQKPSVTLPPSPPPVTTRPQPPIPVTTRPQPPLPVTTRPQLPLPVTTRPQPPLPVTQPPPQLPSPPKTAAQPKSPPQPSPTRVATPTAEKTAQSPPALSLPPPALVPKPEVKQETKQLGLGSFSPPINELASGGAIATEAEAKAVNKEGKSDDPEEPKQRTITELPSYKSQQGQTRQDDEPKIVSPVVQKGRTTSSATESHPKPPPSLGRRERPVLQHSDIRDDVSKLVNKLGTVGHPKQYLTEDEGPVSVITLAGDNRGASMQLGGREPARKEGPVHIHKGYKLNYNSNNQVEDYSEMTTDEESSSKERKTRGPIKSGGEEVKASKSYVNSNVQGVNNSIMFNGSYSERSPGVHLVFSRNLKDQVAMGGSGTSSVETRRADFSVNEAQKLTHEPKVRLRASEA